MQTVDKFLEFVEDNYGDDTIVKDDVVMDVISTGSLALDISTGIGGVPMGRFTEIYGPESSGKTTIALSIIKEALKLGKSALMLDVERGVDYRFISSIIGEYDKEKLLLLSPETAEDTFEIAEQAIASNAFDLIVLDSLGGMSPEKEKADDLVDANVALLPRLLAKWLRRNSYEVKKNNIAFVFINQVRDRIGSYMGGYTAPGGHALSHYLSLRIKFTKGGKYEETIDGNKVTTGISTKFVIEKNKLAVPFRSYTVPISFGKGVDYYRDVLEFTSMLGVVRRAGAFYKFNDQVLGQGLAKASLYLEENQEVLDKIIEMCYNII